MNSGPSRELLELWAPDSRNGLIVTGYSVEGTMARVSAKHQGGPVSVSSCIPSAVLYVQCEAMDISFSHPFVSLQHGLLAYECELMFIRFFSTALGYPQRARRNFDDERSKHSEKALGRLHILQRTCRLLAKFRVHGVGQATAHRKSHRHVFTSTRLHIDSGLGAGSWRGDRDGSSQGRDARPV